MAERRVDHDDVADFAVNELPTRVAQRDLLNGSAGAFAAAAVPAGKAAAIAAAGTLCSIRRRLMTTMSARLSYPRRAGILRPLSHHPVLDEACQMNGAHGIHLSTAGALHDGSGATDLYDVLVEVDVRPAEVEQLASTGSRWSRDLLGHVRSAA